MPVSGLESRIPPARIAKWAGWRCFARRLCYDRLIDSQRIETVATTRVFHPAVADWFDRRFSAPTAAQAEAWPAIQAGQNVLIAAPTGSGKTLAAFLAAIDALVRQALEGKLKDETQIVYVSPLKALSNDIQKNLQEPLAGIREALQKQSLPDVEIRTWVR